MILSVNAQFLQEQTLNLRLSLFYGQLLCRTVYLEAEVVLQMIPFC